MKTLTKSRLPKLDFPPVSNGQSTSKTVSISPPNIKVAKFTIIGTAPLVIHRFSQKAKASMLEKMEAGSTAKKGKKREAFNKQEAFDGARYRSKDGWDGFNVACIRAGLISACRLVGFKMTMAKLSLFVEAEGRDALEPQFGLIRIHGSEPRMQEDVARVETGSAYIVVRPAYDDWQANLTIRYDADQFNEQELTNLLARMGEQVGICEGRPDSKNSCGMGWGTFRIKRSDE